MGETGMIAATSAPGPGYEPRAGAPDALAVSVVLGPQQSVLALLLQAASGQSWGAPAGLLAAVRDALRPQARFAVQSFTARGWTTIPDSCMPISPLADVSVADQAARLRDMPAAALTGELQAADGGCHCPPQWRAAADQPRRWLNSMADASLDTWAVAEPRWRAAGPLLDREIRRVGTAAVRGGMAALLNSLHPGLSYHDGTFAYTPPCDPRFTLGPLGPVGPRRLVLVPMIAGRNALLFSFERPRRLLHRLPAPPAPPGRTGHGRQRARNDPGPGARRHTSGPSPAADRERPGRSRALRAHHRDLPPPPAGRSRPDHPREVRAERMGQPHRPRQRAGRPAIGLTLPGEGIELRGLAPRPYPAPPPAGLPGRDHRSWTRLVFPARMPRPIDSASAVVR